MLKYSQFAILLVSAPDRKGLTAFLTELIFSKGGNIIDLQQHVDHDDKLFFMRLVWSIDEFELPANEIHTWLHQSIPAVYELDWRVHFSSERPNVAVLVSKESHCLYEIISRVQSKEWDINLSMVISNHPDLEVISDRYAIPFQCFPSHTETRLEQEKLLLNALQEYRVDLIVLARYMQVLSPTFVNRYSNRIINIHHSFLPAFPGSKPYQRAFQRGVKIIGATSHYVTSELDAGPIIAQGVVPVSHLDNVQNFVSKGRDIEKIVLARALETHIHHKILVWRNKTIVFY